MSREIVIAVESRVTAWVKGYGSRELVTEVRRGRPPLWSHRLRAWSCQEATALDVAALAELRHYAVRWTGLDELRRDAGLEYEAEQAAAAEARGVLW